MYFNQVNLKTLFGNLLHYVRPIPDVGAKFSVTRVCSSLNLCQNIGAFVPIKVPLKTVNIGVLF